MWSLWIRTIARGMDVSPGPYITDQLSYPPDIVDDNEEHLDDTYVESLENTRPGTENLVSEDPRRILLRRESAGIEAIA